MVRLVPTATRRSAPAPDFVHAASADGRVRLLCGDVQTVLPTLPDGGFDVIFADPPYFLSNGGTTCRSGRRTSVDKGRWDRSAGVEADHAFHLIWLEQCRRLLAPNGTIWVSGTHHVIYSVGFAMQKLGFRILNDVVWEKPNPPPNLSCRTFTHATEILLWASRDRSSKHYFDYPAMRAENGGKQMKTVWRMPAPGKTEKKFGKHPTQKPLRLLERVLRASCPEGGAVLDPFNGSGTTAVAALRAGSSYVGVDVDPAFLDLTMARLEDEAPDLFAAPPRRRRVGVAG